MSENLQLVPTVIIRWIIHSSSLAWMVDLSAFLDKCIKNVPGPLWNIENQFHPLYSSLQPKSINNCSVAIFGTTLVQSST